MSDNTIVVGSLTREELYEKVWSRPVAALASSLGISNSELAKLCRKLNIPMPGRGYWWRMEMGIAAERTPLPDLVNVEETKVPLDLPEKPPKPQRQLTETERRIAEEKKLENRIVVSDQLVSPHPLIERTQRSLASAKPDPDGRVMPKAKGCLDVCVGADSIDRAMRIMDALIKALEARGYAISTSGEKEGKTRVRVDDEDICFSLVGLLDRREKEPSAAQKREFERYPGLFEHFYRKEYERFPNGHLVLEIDNFSGSIRRRWSDTPSQRVEDRLNRFMTSVVRIAEDMKRSRLEAQERARIWQEQAEERERLRKEEDQRRLEEERRRREEQWRSDWLKAKLTEWHHAEQIRAFMAAVRHEAIRRHGEIQEGSEIAQWLAWAERYASQHDPLADCHELPTYMPDERTRSKLEPSLNASSCSSDYGRLSTVRPGGI